MENKHIRNNSK